MNRIALIPRMVLALACASAAAGICTGQGQQKAESTAFRAGSSEVFVDAVVTDKKGSFMPGLKPEDFLVYEDGVLQEIASFRLAGRAHDGGGNPNVPIPAARPLLTMVLLDYSSTEFQNEKLVRDGADRYIKEKMRPGDRMAVFALTSGLRTLAPFTSDRQMLAAAFGWREQVDAAKSGTRPDTVLDTSASVSTPSISGSTTMGGDLGGSDRMAGLFSAMMSGVEQRTSRGMLAAIRALSQEVSNREGRKALMVFSQGFVVDPVIQGEMQSAIADAQKANVSIYCFDSSGLTNPGSAAGGQQREDLNTAIKLGADQKERIQAAGGQGVFDRAVVSGRDMGVSALRFIANETGGFLVRNTNSFTPGLARVDQAMREYYLLTYRPKNTAADGKFRAIRVELRQPGLTVRARSGYYAVPPGLDALSTAELQFLLAGRGATASAGNSLFLKTPGFREQDGRYRVPVIVETLAKNVQFARRGESYSARMSVLGLIRNTSKPDEPPASFVRTAQIDLNEAEYKAFEPGSMRLMENLRLQPGSYSLEIVMKDLLSAKLFHREQGIYLRDQGKKLALSTILLSNEFSKATKADESSESVFLAQGVKISPCAQCEFHNGDNMIFYVEAYNPTLDAQTSKSDLIVDLALLVDGKRVNVTLPRYRVNEAIQTGHMAVPVARYLQLSNLPPGNYSLVVQVTDAPTGQAEGAHATFHIAN